MNAFKALWMRFQSSDYHSLYQGCADINILELYIWQKELSSKSNMSF